ncbi:retrovirus-related Pol polyprotein [Pseudoscourfieldia marina]
MFLKEMDSGHLYTELTSLTNVDEAYPTLPINAGQWHARLGHLHPRRIENFPSDAEQIPADAECPACQLHKSKRTRREPAQSITEYKIGEVWSTDAIRPGTIDVSGVTTFFPFIDYGSRFVFDYYAVSKEITEYIAILKQWVSDIHTVRNTVNPDINWPKQLRTDHEQLFMHPDCVAFLNYHGITAVPTYAPVVQYQTLRTLLAIYSARGFYFGQIDVETAYLYALNEIWILVYVDDIIFASKNERRRKTSSPDTSARSTELRNQQPTWALGMKVSFAADGIILTQDLYVSKILERFGFTSAAKSATTPLAHGTTLTRADEEDGEARHLAQFVGAILYAAVIAGGLSSTVRVMSHVMSKPPSNFEACKKHVLRYLSGTINRGIKYNTNSNVPLKLIGSRRKAGDNHENRRSTSGYIFFLNGGPISWASYWRQP